MGTLKDGITPDMKTVRKNFKVKPGTQENETIKKIRKQMRQPPLK
jgi:hypothetical protein